MSTSFYELENTFRNLANQGRVIHLETSPFQILCETPKGNFIRLVPVSDVESTWGIYTKHTCAWYSRKVGATAENSGLVNHLPAVVDAF